MAGWQEWLMRGNFSHVLCFSQANNQVVMLDPVQSNMKVLVHNHPHGCHLPLYAEVIALDCSLNGGTVVRITMDVDKTPTSHAITNFFPGCVTIAKGLLGVSAWVFTPWQFYVWLLEHGGVLYDRALQEVVFEELTGCHLSEIQGSNIFRYLGGQTVAKKDASKGTRDRLKDEESTAKAEASKLEEENRQRADARRRASLGRSSLITTSELGVVDKLG